MDIKAYFELMRVPNGIMTMIAVAIGYFIVAKAITLSAGLAMAMIAAFFVFSAGCAANDYFDLPIDRKNKPKRPLPSGRVSKREVIALITIFLLIALSLAWLINGPVFMLVVISASSLLTYAAFLSRKLLVGNTIVAFNTALAFVFGEAAFAGTFFSREISVLFLLAFFSTLAREIYKSIEDMKADKGLRITLPIAFGVKNSALLAGAFVLLSIIVSPIPYLLGIFGLNFLAGVVIADLFFVYIAYSGLMEKIPERFKTQATYMKVAQLIALLAFVAGIL
jgi:geranylgeranylglycerol-phosphate geranylgeranyltransferase